MNLFKRPKWLLALGLAVPVVLLLLAWRAGKRRPHPFIGIASPAVAIALSRDGSEIVCASDNGVIQKWRPERARFNSFYAGDDMESTNGFGFGRENAAPIDLRFSPDEQWLVAANAGNYQPKPPAAWAMSDRSLKWVVAPQINPNALNPSDRGVPATRFALSSDAHTLACAGDSWTRVLDLTRPKPYVRGKTTAHLSKAASLTSNFATVAQLPMGALQMALSPDGKRLALATGSGQLVVWDIATRVQTPLFRAATISALAFSPDARFLAVLSSDQPLALYDFGIRKWTYGAAATPPARITFSTGGGFVPLGAPDVITLAWMPDSRSLWVGGDAAKQFNAPDLKIIRTLPVSGPVAVSGDGRILATRSLPRPGEPNGVWEWEIG